MKENNISGNLFDIKILKRLFIFCRPYMSVFYTLIILTLSLSILQPIRPYITQIIIDDYVSMNDVKGLKSMTLLLFGLLIVNAIVVYFHTYLSGWLGQNIIQLFGIVALMFYINWKLTLVSLATLPFLFLTTYIFKEKVKISFNNVRSAVANLNTFVQEHIVGMNIVQIFGNEKKEYEKFEKINELHLKANLKAVLYYSIYFPVMELFTSIGLGLLIWYGSGQLFMEEVTLGVLIAFIMYLQLFFRPIRSIADRFNTLQMGVVSSKRIFDLLDKSESIKSKNLITNNNIEAWYEVLMRNKKKYIRKKNLYIVD